MPCGFKAKLRWGQRYNNLTISALGPAVAHNDKEWKMRGKSAAALAGAGILLIGLCGYADETNKAADPHYTAAGFFDIHVCNWPDRPLFYMALFSTTHFDELSEVEVDDPDGRALGKLELTKYHLVLDKGKPEKRVFISQLPIPTDARDGWYQARITLKDGKTIVGKDYVAIRTMPQPNGFNPADKTEIPDVPEQLSWNPVPGAQFYQVTIKDAWADDKVIHTSKLLSEPRLMLPPGMLQKGGSYSWRVHARDIDEDVKLGDFNYGTLGRELEFSIAQ